VRIFALLFAALLSLGLVAATTGQDSDDGATLYEVDLETGEASEVDSIGDGLDVIGLALAPLPETADDPQVAYALTTDGMLVEFEVDTPAETTSEVEISGLEDDEALIGIDVRPATDELFAVSDASTLYSVDTESGEATAIDGPFDPVLENVVLGFDFNPTVDRIRADVSTTQNLRLNPENGMVGTNPDTGEPTIDGNLAYAEGDDNSGETPFVVGAAYTNSVADAEETELYSIDANTDTLNLQDPPNDGTQNTVGELGVDATELTGFDISQPDTETDPEDEGTAYLAISPFEGLTATPSPDATPISGVSND